MSKQIYTESRPLRSPSIGCHPSQAREFNALLKKHGVTGAEYSEKTGMCSITSRTGEKDVMRILGIHPNK